MEAHSYCYISYINFNNNNFFFLKFTVIIILVLDLLTPVYFLCTRVSLFFISIILITN